MKPVEKLAYALLQTHCADLRGFVFFPSPDMSYPFIPGTLFLQDVRTKPGDTPQRLGARMRLALDVVNACCACEELHPVTNQRFWRRVESSLWLTDGGHSCLSESKFEEPLLTEDSFARYVLIFDVCTSSNAHVAFWRNFFLFDMSPFTAECQVTYQRILAKLRRHMSLPIRQLTITVFVDGSGLQWQPEQRQAGVLYNLMEGGDQSKILQTLARLANHPGNTVDLKLIVRDAVNSPIPLPFKDSWDLLTALQAGPRVSVEHLEIQLMSHGQSPDTVRSQLAPLGALLRVAVLHSSAWSLIIDSTPYSDTKFVGAAYSIVPHAKTLRVLEDAAVVMDAPLRLMRLAWLLYATHHPRRAAGISLVIKTHCDDDSLNASELQYMEELVQAKIPLRDVVYADLQTRYANGPGGHVDCFALGATVFVATGTIVYCEPGRLSVEFAVASLVHDECVDVVAHVLSDGSVGVVYPGYGLVWVHISAVTWMANADALADNGDAVDETAGLGESTALSSLTLHLKYLFTGLYAPRPGNSSPQLLPFFICSTLEVLELCRAEIRREILQNILRSCPRLQTLRLRWCSVESLSPLPDAYTSSSGCQVSTLTLSAVVVSEQSFASIFDALCQPRHPLTIMLRELHVDLSTLPQQNEVADFERLLCALEAPRLRLRRVTMKATMVLRLPQAMQARLKRLKLRRLSDPPRAIALATLSVLREKGPHVYDESVARAVLWFIGGSEKLSVGWAARSPYDRTQA